jgi:hypothetical protein
MSPQHDYDRQAAQELARARLAKQGRARVAEPDDGQDWTIGVTLFAALAVAAMLTALL